MSLQATSHNLQRLAVLGYHKIGPPPADGWETWFYIPENTFLRHLEFLRDDGWNVIDVETFLQGTCHPESLPPKSVLITFDDGYRSLLDAALRCLSKLEFPAIVFVPTAYIGGFNDFEDGAEPREAICAWDELRELERRNISVQSHGVTHRGLTDMDATGQRNEIFRSKAILEKGLEKNVDLFSFAYGDNGDDSEVVQRLLREADYAAAFLYGGGPIQLPLETRFGIARIAVGPDTDLQAELNCS